MNDDELTSEDPVSGEAHGDETVEDDNTAAGDAAPAADGHLVDLPLVTSDAELSFAEALSLTGRRGARLVAMMGEVGVGKTTVMVEIWTRLVGVGAIGEYRCAGSRTAIAFEERAFLSRMAAGVGKRSTARTHYGENEGLLHFRLARPDGEVSDLLLADYSGERYERVREGAHVEDELPWTPRMDRMLFLLDGSALKAAHTREIEADNVARLLYAMRSAGIVGSGTRVALLITRADEIDEAVLADSRTRLDALLAIARDLDESAEVLRVAARPADGEDPSGFEELLDWICCDRIATPRHIPTPLPRRSIGRLRDC